MGVRDAEFPTTTAHFGGYPDRKAASWSEDRPRDPRGPVGGGSLLLGWGLLRPKVASLARRRMLLFRRRSRRKHPESPPMEEGKRSGGSAEDGGVGEEEKCCHGNQRSRLEQEVQKLQEELQEELDLHIVLANAVGSTALQLLGSSGHVPEKAQELLSSIATLEMTVSKLEDELVSLHFRLGQERNERRLYEHQLKQPPVSAYPSETLSLCWSWDDKKVSSMELSSCHQLPHLLQPDILDHCCPSPSPSRKIDAVSDEESEAKPVEEVSESSSGSPNEEDISLAPQSDVNIDNASRNVWARDLHLHPNKLSEEMVRCMRNIYLCLSESSTLPSKTSSSAFVPHPSSPVGHLPCTCLMSPSGSSVAPSFSPNLTTELCNYFENKASETRFDPYGVCGKAHQISIGSYSSAAEVSWMTVGKKQLEYAAEALKQFRVLVEQLAKVDPAKMSCNQRLAFWINLYNALIMHAYLAYGVPGSDVKLFSLMQKASYTVGGHSFSAAEIEYLLLKMKPPAHRPQMALTLARHKFKVSEVHHKYSLEALEPLVGLALSCGMYSSPAVRIFTADKIHEELERSLRDYVRASVGINDKGKLLVPKLLYCFAKDVVEDSLLVDWVCRFLTPEQVSLVRDSASQRKQRLLGARSFTIVQFDSRFRYLFLPDEKCS